jgi:serine/threonine protein kinase
LAIRYLHNENEIYKTLTPSNIIVGDDGYLQLIDFGSCRIALKKELYEQDIISNCAPYLAPEILNS